jgi:medium-chain acyl-[acyl-carrier-protein] hydrolase
MLAPEIEVTAIRLPGRETRFREPVPQRIQDLAAEVIHGIAPLLDTPYAMFGHSMGALTAFEVCQAARAQGLREPVRLLVSGRPAPQLRLRQAPVHSAPRRELVARLQEYRGTQPELLSDPEALDAFISVLRADLAMSETYHYDPRPPLECPVSAFGGTDDTFATPAELDAWRIHTTAGFCHRSFPGGHFFLHEAPAEVVRAMTDDLSPSRAWP